MEKCLSVAKLLCDMYKEAFHCEIDEMKTHKLMYFAQRESLILFDEPLFDDECFRGWKFGPVLKCVRDAFRNSSLKDISPSSSDRAKEVIDCVIKRYGSLSAWTLSGLSHQEISWKVSRVGLQPDDNGNKIISNDAIRIDASREKTSRSLN